MKRLRRVRRTRRGDYELRLPAAERELLRSLPAQLRELLDEGNGDDPAMRRLYPSAHLDDERAAAEFDALIRDDLTRQRRQALETMERTADATRIDEAELTAWLACVNDLRLVLGVRLAVTEESRPEDFAADPDTERAYATYAYLSYLEEEIVDALSGGLASR